MVQSAGLFSSCSCIVDPIANSYPCQTISSLVQRIADFARGIFTAIAECVKSCLGYTPAPTILPGASTQTAAPGPVPAIVTPPGIPAPSEALLTATSAAAGPPPTMPQVLEGGHFLKDRLVHLIQNQDENRLNHGELRNWMTDEWMATQFLAALIVHDLAMDPSSVVGLLPHLVTCGIGDTERTFASEIEQLRQKFSALSNKDKRMIKITFLEMRDLENPVDSISREFFKEAQETALKFIAPGLNPTFIASASATFRFCHDFNDFMVRAYEAKSRALIAETTATSPSAATSRTSNDPVVVQVPETDFTKHLAKSLEGRSIKEGADFLKARLQQVKQTFNVVGFMGTEETALPFLADLFVYDLVMEHNDSLKDPLPSHNVVQRHIGDTRFSFLDAVQRLREKYRKLTTTDKIELQTHFCGRNLGSVGGRLPFNDNLNPESAAGKLLVHLFNLADRFKTDNSTFLESAKAVYRDYHAV